LFLLPGIMTPIDILQSTPATSRNTEPWSVEAQPCFASYNRMPRANRPTTYSGNYEWEGLVPIPRFCWETDTRLSIGARHGRLEALGGVYSKADCGSRWLL